MTPAETLNLQLRPMEPGDLNYVLSSWLRSYSSAPEFRRMTPRAYFALYEPAVKDMLARSEVMVATLPEEPSVIVAWLAIEGSTVHYVLVKPSFRTKRVAEQIDKVGVASLLLADLKDSRVVYTHQPPSWARLPAEWIYDPDARFRKAAA